MTEQPIQMIIHILQNIQNNTVKTKTYTYVFKQLTEVLLYNVSVCICVFSLTVAFYSQCHSRKNVGLHHTASLPGRRSAAPSGGCCLH